ncbi:hypothetical protein [Oceanirhabdus sp. W0125-5]|nr:hypothetical protein [Oceanirhabdus sp. W0125-5]WBW96504.1 hypothetical protein OW730_22830 [Oceanirhabdus sp. W0125-5]
MVTCFSDRLYGVRDESKLKKTINELEKERQMQEINENNNESNFDKS